MEEGRIAKFMIYWVRREDKRLNINDFTNAIDHYNNLKLFEDEVDDKVRICWVKKHIHPSPILDSEKKNRIWVLI